MLFSCWGTDCRASVLRATQVDAGMARPFIQGLALSATYPLLAISAALAVNRGMGVGLVVVFLIWTALLPILAVLLDFEERAYPFLLYGGALGLLFHNSLVSDYVSGYDIHIELFLAKNVLHSGSWDVTYLSKINGMLSIVILAPATASVSGLGLVDLFKWVYPAIFAGVAPVLFLIGRRLFRAKTAFLTTFVFVGTFVFYTELLQVARQEIAEFLIAIFLMVLTAWSSSAGWRRTFLIIFLLVSIICAHYGSAYLLILLLGAGMLLAVVLRPLVGSQPLRQGVSPFTFVLTAGFLYIWYNTVAGSSSFYDFTWIGFGVMRDFSTRLLDPGAAQGLSIIQANLSPMREVTKGLHILIQLLMIAGVFSHLRRSKVESRWTPQFLVSCCALALLAATIALPGVGNAFNTSRIYHFAQFLLIFYVPQGLSATKNLFTRLSRKELTGATGLKVSAVFLGAFLIFNSGLMYKAFHDPPASLALDEHVDDPRFTVGEVTGGRFLSSVAPNSFVLGDAYRQLLLRGFYQESRVSPLPDLSHNLTRSAEIFLGSWNLHEGMYAVQNFRYAPGHLPDYYETELRVRSMSRYYDNGDAAATHFQLP